ncbi:Zn-ribbon domain-containing OB-fold protein [Candidimonas nitroreducens]|nr:OB-fold domain-containing protein [Candidimonas nitroreducens]
MRESKMLPADESVSAKSVILPEASGAVQMFWQGAASGKLLVQRCQHCGHIWHPPSDVCGKCQSMNIDWVPASGKGVLYSYTKVQHAVHAAVQSWIPYILCMVELDEGTRILSLFDDAKAPPLIGKTVALRFQKMPEGLQLPIFFHD